MNKKLTYQKPSVKLVTVKTSLVYTQATPVLNVDTVGDGFPAFDCSGPPLFLPADNHLKDTWNFDINTIVSPPTDDSVTVEVVPPGTMDIFLEVYPPAGLLSCANNGGAGVTESVTFTPPQTGSYQIFVYDISELGGTYSLTVSSFNSFSTPVLFDLTSNTCLDPVPTGLGGCA